MPTASGVEALEMVEALRNYIGASKDDKQFYNSEFRILLFTTWFGISERLRLKKDFRGSESFCTSELSITAPGFMCYVGMHEGGHVPFHFDITEALNGAQEEVTVRVEDPSTDETIPRGKQFWLEQSHAIWYTRTTGIWQTVWLEAVNAVHLTKVKFQPDLDRGDCIAEFEISGSHVGTELDVMISYKGQQVVTDRIKVQDRYVKRAFHLFNLNIFRTLALLLYPTIRSRWHG